MNILITGGLGFIGFSLCKKLLENKKYQVHSIDNINKYYDFGLKKLRKKELLKQNNKFYFYKQDILNYDFLKKIFKKHKYDYVIHLAAQAGVRKSISDPTIYLNSNIVGFYNVLKICNEENVKHFLFASSSSVYGKSKKFPLSETDITDTPESFYAATKKSNEILGHSFSEIYKIPITALRFFTVYGEYGRPDMAPFKFTKNIANGQEIDLYNGGDHYRDFTYIDDVTEAIIKLIPKVPNDKKLPFRIINIGSGKTIKISKFVKLIEKKVSKKAKINHLPMQTGDVHKTQANVQKLTRIIKKKKFTSIEQGMSKFIDWYLNIYT